MMDQEVSKVEHHHPEQNGSPLHGSTSRPPHKMKHSIRTLVFILIALIVVGGAYAVYKHDAVPASTKASQETKMTNEDLLKNNKAQALVDAKKALANNPSNVENILAVASLTQAENPSQAEQYYIEAYNVFKEQNNPDVSGKSAETYWAAAGLAEQAGESSQAKQYYQEVIQVANPSNSYEQSLAQQSQVALKRLQ
jgi:Tfp pilus assembly protein PilF